MNFRILWTEGTEGQVCGDIVDRQQFGKRKYGVTVEESPLDLRRWLTHAYQESLDLPIYLRRALAEREVCKRAAPGWMRGKLE